MIYRALARMLAGLVDVFRENMDMELFYKIIRYGL